MKPSRASARHGHQAPGDIWWTPWPGTGAGSEVLGDLTDKTVIELGCGTGRNAAAMAASGAQVTAIDRSKTAIARARHDWDHVPQLRFLETGAATYLTRTHERADMICSIFGALTFTPAEQLLPLIAQRLAPDGRLAASLRTHDAMPAGDGPAKRRYTYRADHWAGVLFTHSLHPVTTIHVRSPHAADAGCLISVAARHEPLH